MSAGVRTLFWLKSLASNAQLFGSSTSRSVARRPSLTLSIHHHPLVRRERRPDFPRSTFASLPLLFPLPSFFPLLPLPLSTSLNPSILLNLTPSSTDVLLDYSSNSRRFRRVRRLRSNDDDSLLFLCKPRYRVDVFLLKGTSETTR